jgi:hypothetical protein
MWYFQPREKRRDRLGDVQVTWATFPGMEGANVLCMLQQATLTTYSLSGELQTVPLPTDVTDMHPLPLGLILSVRFHLLVSRVQHQLCSVNVVL